MTARRVELDRRQRARVILLGPAAVVLGTLILLPLLVLEELLRAALARSRGR